MQDSYDVVVVGGGPAGLSAALTLARARRRVLVVDRGEPRNAPAGAVHGYLGREGVAPSGLLAAGREEVEHHGGEVVPGTVVDVEVLHAWSTDPVELCVRLEGGAEVRARRVLLAVGMVDELPDVPGVAERWGRDVLHCPYCHGWELDGARVAVLATSPGAVQEALLFRQWSPDVTLVLHDAPEPDEVQAERLAARGVAVVAGPALRLAVEDDRLVGVELLDGGTVACEAVVVQPVVSAPPGLHHLAGVRPHEAVDDGRLVDRHLPADAAGATATPGVWAAGNLADPGAQVATAVAAGLHTAAALNVDLVEEDVRVAVARHRAAQDAGRAPSAS